MKSRGSQLHPQVILVFTSFLGSPESTAKSNMHPMSSATILRHLSSQWTVIGSLSQGQLPIRIWFHLVMLMTKINPSVTFPSLLYNPSRNPIIAFCAVTHLPSYGGTLILASPSIGKDSSHQNIQNQGIYLLQTIILVIACSWQPVDTIGYKCPTMALLLKFFTNILLHFPIYFSNASNSCSWFQPPNQACSCIPVPST